MFDVTIKFEETIPDLRASYAAVTAEYDIFGEWYIKELEVCRME